MKFSFFPTKNINMSETLFCLGGIILFLIKNNDNLDIDNCYNLYITEFVEKKLVKYKLSFSNFVFAVDYLYIVNLITIKENKLVINYENFKIIFR